MEEETHGDVAIVEQFRPRFDLLIMFLTCFIKYPNFVIQSRVLINTDMKNGSYKFVGTLIAKMSTLVVGDVTLLYIHVCMTGKLETVTVFR